MKKKSSSSNSVNNLAQIKAVESEPDLGPKEFGPKAVLDWNKIGNYEPTLVHQSGPGKNSTNSYPFRRVTF